MVTGTVTGTSVCDEPPGRTVQEDDAVVLHRFRNECTLTSSDPRLSGTGVYDVQQFASRRTRASLHGLGYVRKHRTGWHLGRYLRLGGGSSRTELPGWGSGRAPGHTKAGRTGTTCPT